MKYPRFIIEELKQPQYLHAYCSAALGGGRQEGKIWKYPCPFGTHTRLKLEVDEKNGVGVAICRACNKGGTVIDIAAANLGLNVKTDFIRCVEEVAEKTGYRLTKEKQTMYNSNSVRIHKKMTSPVSVQPQTSPKYLPHDEESKALAAVKRANENPDRMKSHADELGLPVNLLLSHTDIAKYAPAGLLGLTPEGLLLYVYSVMDESGNIRIQSTKRRNFPGMEPRFIQQGSKNGLWGASLISTYQCRRVIITEGESDALALRASCRSWYNIWKRENPETLPTATVFPVILAKPDANTFKPEWALPLRGLDVILACDADSAGEKGTERTIETLQAAGIKRIFTWRPPASHKDARSAFDINNPHLLIEDIMTHKIRIK